MTWSTGSARGGDWWDAGPRAGRDDTILHRTSRGEPIDSLREETIVYRDVQGARRTMRARVTDDQVGSHYHTRLVVDADTLTEYVQKRAHAAGRRRPTHAATASRTPDGIDAIDNEIQIGLHLVDAFGERDYPRELSRLFGYYPDDADPEPFVLLVERGRPVERFAGRLLLDQSEQFPLSLLRALDLLESAQVVHRWLNTDTILFDDRHVQITDFRHAVFTDERCGPAPDQNAAPEALGGTAVATTKEDMYGAGHVLLRVTGEGRRTTPRRGGGDRLLGEDGLIARMIDYDPGRRPSITELLAALDQGLTSAASRARGPRSVRSPQFVEGRSAFDAIVRRRRSADDEAAATGPADGGSQRGR